MTAAKAQKGVTLRAHPPTSGKGELKILGGSNSDDFNNQIAIQVINSLWLKHSSEQDKEKQFAAAVAALAGVRPQDELEGMLAAQILAAHHAAMECYRRAMIPDQTFEGRREGLNQANKLSRTATMLVEALNRHRGKRQQKVTVEHVHVHAGGQAIVGSVEQGGGGVRQDGTHTSAITHAPQSPLRGKDETRKAVPVSRDAKRQVSDARRPVSRRTER
jgi:hypothetical protein